MADINNVTLVGRVARDIEVSTTQSGTSVVRNSLALNGRKEDDVSFVNIVVFGKAAEVVSKYVQKGDRLGVVGRLSTSSYTDKQGVKRYDTSVIANEIMLIGGNRGGGQQQGESKDVVVEDFDVDAPIDLSEIPF